MKVTVVGSADAFNGAGRFHSCYVVDAPELGRVMIDFGGSSLAALRRVGMKASSIDAFVFTHLHGDHIGGFPFLVIDALFSDPRDRPLEIVGPLGVEARMRDLLDVTYGSAILGKAPIDLRFTEVAPHQSLPIAGYLLRTFPRSHGPAREPALSSAGSARRKRGRLLR